MFCAIKHTFLKAYATDKDADDQVEYDLNIANELSGFVKIDIKHGTVSVKKLPSFHGLLLLGFS